MNFISFCATGHANVLCVRMQQTKRSQQKWDPYNALQTIRTLTRGRRNNKLEKLKSGLILKGNCFLTIYR